MLRLQTYKLIYLILIFILNNYYVNSFPKVSIGDIIVDISNDVTETMKIDKQPDEQLILNTNNDLNDLKKSMWQMTGSPNTIRNLQSKVMQSYMNNTIDPCDDFYTYSCGNWENLHPIPKDNSEFNVFSFLNMNILDALKEILSNPISNNIKNSGGKLNELSAEDKSKLFYSACTDMSTINHRSTEPLLNFIDTLGGWPALDDNWNNNNKFDLIDLCAKATRLGIRHFLNLGVEIDLKNTKNYALYLEEAELGLDNHDDYLIEENVSHLNGYKNLIITILTLLEIEHDKAEEAANEIINFEINLANITTELRTNVGVHDQYFGTNIGDIEKNYPQLNITRYINLVFNKEFQSDQYVVLFASPRFGEMIEFLSNTDNRTLCNYIIWRCVKATYRRLDERFLDAAQIFDESLTGQKEPESQWKKCVQFINEKMGMAVGAQFVRPYFNENSKKDVELLTQEIRNIFEQTLNSLDWIDNETKRKSKEKVNIIQLAVGYPDFILKTDVLNQFYNNVHIENGKHFENAINLVMFEHMNRFQNLGKEVDKSEWPAYPAIVNAFFEPTKNRIIVPAGVLQPPIYHRSLPKALNYGGIGVFVGHELTHGFDDSGREFDSDGNMITWWSNNSIQHFIDKTNCFIEQYSNFSLHGKFLSGEASKSENIADNGGIRQAFKAYKKWLKNASQEELSNEKLPNLDLTNEQLYFLGFAQAWCGQIRPEAIENIIETDAHCPGRFRVIGTLQNFEEFGKAYNCPIGTAMNPTKKCQLW